jgi:hypothetical protein
VIRRLWSNPVSLLLLATALFTFLIQSGEMGTADTARRLQVTHSLWTGEPQVLPNDYPDFGIPGRDGALYAWYGIGQSVLMLPADMAGTAASHLPMWRHYVESRATPGIRDIVVSVSTNVLLNVLTALVAFRFLGLLGFSVGESIAGTLALLCGTTHLHYAQNMQENNYLFLLTLTGLALQYRWLRTGDRRSLLLGAGALGLNLLTRLTSVLDIVVVAWFLVLLEIFSRGEARGRPQKIWTYLLTTAPVYAVFLFLDRLYQFVRFGSWTNTYMSLQAAEQRRWDPSLPANFPFSGHFFRGGIHAGIPGPLLSPQKSIFLFDPLFPLAVVLTVVLWRRLAPEWRAFAVASWTMVAMYMVLYARYFTWAGDSAWGDRYISSAVEMAALLAVPLLVRYRREVGRAAWGCGLTVVAISVAIQVASLAFWLPLELYQMENAGRDAWTIPLRFRNIADFAMGRRLAMGIDLPGAVTDRWDAMHIHTWNFMPALMRHVGVAPVWAVDVLDGVWMIAGAALVVVLVRLWRTISRSGPVLAN